MPERSVIDRPFAPLIETSSAYGDYFVDLTGDGFDCSIRPACLPDGIAGRHPALVYLIASIINR
jgi:hypothetical protein